MPSHIKSHFLSDTAFYCRNRPCFLPKKAGWIWTQFSLNIHYLLVDVINLMTLAKLSLSLLSEKFSAKVLLSYERFLGAWFLISSDTLCLVERYVAVLWSQFSLRFITWNPPISWLLLKILAEDTIQNVCFYE